MIIISPQLGNEKKKQIFGTSKNSFASILI